jgi:pimeloyl-ACP methyl ester carboxylesterase
MSDNYGFAKTQMHNKLVGVRTCRSKEKQMLQSIVKTETLEFFGLQAGEGTPCLLLHGFPDVCESFGYHVNALAKAGYKAVAPALRGYPPTGGPGPYTIGRLVEDTIEISTALGMSPEHPGFVVGHDWGGIAACLAAARTPEIFRKIVVASVPHPAVFGARILQGDYDQLKRRWYMFFFQLQGVPEAAIRASRMALLERLMLDWSPSLLRNEGSELIAKRIEALSVPGSLEAAISYYRSIFPKEGSSPEIAPAPVNVPTLVIFGSEDGCITPTFADGQDFLFPAGYEKKVITGSGHFVHSESPEAFTAEILRFFGQ